MKILLIAYLFIYSISVFSQSTTTTTNNNKETEELLDYINGKNYWFHISNGIPDYCRKVEFFENGKKLPLNFSNALTFKFYREGSLVKAKINEQINATVTPDSLEKDMFIYSNDEQYLNIFFSEVEPIEHYKKIIQIEKKKEALAAKNKKGGVRIGMTAKQVREKTDWGSPVSINATITSYGSREQWVYGYGNYLYFRNGILESIQVSK